MRVGPCRAEAARISGLLVSPEGSVSDPRVSEIDVRGLVRTFQVEITDASGELLLSISDRGEGMPEAMLRSAIVPFSSSKPGGAGVGLALCHEVIRGHGGRMILRSRVREGTTVTCVLPTSIEAKSG